MQGSLTESDEATMSGYVLVLDDDEVMRDLLQESLESDGFRVQIAGSIDAALQLARRADPRVVLFDLTLGAQGGQTFVASYRALPGANASLIVVSGAPGLAQVATDLRLAGHLTKPFDLDDLCRLVRERFDGVG